jgi:hypothetical protein
MDADAPATAERLHRERIVDLGGGGVVDREGCHRRGLEHRQRRQQRIECVRARAVHGESGASPEMIEQETPVMEIVRRGDRPAVLHQVGHAGPGRGACGLDRLPGDRLLLGRIEQRRYHRPHGLGQLSGHQRSSPLRLLFSLALASFDAGQRGLQRFGGRALVHALAALVEVHRARMQPQQHRRALHRRRGLAGCRAEVLARRVIEAELVGGDRLPEEIRVERISKRLRVIDQRLRRRRLEAEQHVGRLDLRALAMRRFYLQRGGVVGEHAARPQLAFFLVKNVHQGRSQ